MPFKETCAMEERVGMLTAYDTGAFTVSDLAERYEVSRETFYVWLKRRASGDDRWFEDRSYGPQSSPHRTTGEVVVAAAVVVVVVVRLRERFPHFGPKKLHALGSSAKRPARGHARLMSDAPDRVWPAASTIGDILKREGPIKPRERRRRRIVEAGAIAPPDLAANAEWCTDFKGWFRTRDGKRCDPLTLTDTASRYLLMTRIVDPTYAGVRPAMERVFAEHGLPRSMRCDNGPPFGSPGAGGLSRLSPARRPGQALWWLLPRTAPDLIRGPGSA
ncbi:MAG: hypothetical protein ACREC6_14750 [Hyphomicrobiaceae bacterium]